MFNVWAVFLLRLVQWAFHKGTFASLVCVPRCMLTFTCVSHVCAVRPAAPASLFLVLLCRERAGSHTSSFASSYSFSPKQIIFLRLIKDVSRRLSGICRLSPVLLQFSLPPLCLFFPLHLTCSIFNSTASHPLYRS